MKGLRDIDGTHELISSSRPPLPAFNQGGLRPRKTLRP